MQKQIINPWNWQDAQGWSWGIETQGASRVLYCSGQVSTDSEGRVLHRTPAVQSFLSSQKVSRPPCPNFAPKSSSKGRA
jgi:hypothetical protein